MKNDPLMFIDSFKLNNENMSNQEIFDSRYQKRSLKKYRLEDIKAMMLYRINVLCEIITKKGKIEGFVKELNEENIKVNAEDNKTYLVSLDDILDINILKL